MAERRRRSQRRSQHNSSISHIDNKVYFISAQAGDLPGFEEASRALFADDHQRFHTLIEAWPREIRDHAIHLSEPPRGVSALPADLIPVDKHPAILGLLKASLGDGNIDAVIRIAGGAAGPASVFRVTFGGKDCVLRIEGPAVGLRDPRRHFACLKIAAKAGVAPRLLGADADLGFSIAEFIAAPTVMRAASPAERLRCIVAALRTLHSAPLFPSFMPYLDCVDLLVNQVRVSGVLPPAVLRDFVPGYAALVAAYPRHAQELVSSHNDLNPSNVMFSGMRAWFVDWESAFAADRFVDLAAIANFFAADDADEEIVLQAYFGADLHDEQRARLFLMQQVNRIFYAMVLFNSVAAHEPGKRLPQEAFVTPRFRAVRGEMVTLGTPAGRERFACIFLNEAMLHLRSPRFAQAAELLGRAHP